MIYRIAETRDWEAAQASGYFASPDLAAEGFIHCCTAQQVAAVANRYYQGQEGLVLLEIDETQVHPPPQVGRPDQCRRAVSTCLRAYSAGSARTLSGVQAGRGRSFLFSSCGLSA